MVDITGAGLDRNLDNPGEFRDDGRTHSGLIRRGTDRHYLFVGEGLPEIPIPEGVLLTVYYKSGRSREYRVREE